MDRYLIVTDPVADLRRTPENPTAKSGRDDLLETQLLYNEMLHLRDGRHEGWYSVEAIEQRKAKTGTLWNGYFGWVKARSVTSVDGPPPFNAVVAEQKTFAARSPGSETGQPLILSLGTRLVIDGSDTTGHLRTVLSDGGTAWVRNRDVRRLGGDDDVMARRLRIVETARLFLGTSYLWGGRSIFIPEAESADASIRTGVDCSGLTNLAYRVCGIDIPRDAHDQSIAASKITFDNVMPGDLIFIESDATPGRISHVMLSLGGESFLEALETGKRVSVNTFQDKFGLTLKDLGKQGCRAGDRRISFGTFLDREGWI